MTTHSVPSMSRVGDYWAARLAAGEMTPGSVARYERIFGAFIRFASAHGIDDLCEADRELCGRFVFAAQRNGCPPAPSSSRLRLSVLRDAYEALVEIDPNPTVGLSVIQPPRARPVAPLTPAEVSRLRSAGRVYPRDYLRPSAVELALAGGSNMEIAGVVVADVDLAGERVRLGSRWVNLDDFALSNLAGRVAACRRANRRNREPWYPGRVAVALTRPLDTYPETTIAAGISSSLGRALKKAGITRVGIRPASIREHAANRVYARTGRIEDVSEFLGYESLDRAMGYIDHGWQLRYADEVRA